MAERLDNNLRLDKFDRAYEHDRIVRKNGIFYRGKRIKIIEAPEPNDIIWTEIYQSLDET